MVRSSKPHSQRSLRPVLLWGLLSLLMAGTGAAIGFLVSVPPEVVSTEPAPPRLLQVGDIFSAGLAEGKRGAKRARVHERRAGYRAGFSAGHKLTRVTFAARYRRGGPAHRRIFAEGVRAGERRALGRFRFGAEGFYLVSVVDGGRQVETSRGPLSDSAAYEVCRDGRAICVRGVGP